MGMPHSPPMPGRNDAKGLRVSKSGRMKRPSASKSSDAPALSVGGSLCFRSFSSAPEAETATRPRKTATAAAQP